MRSRTFFLVVLLSLTAVFIVLFLFFQDWIFPSRQDERPPFWETSRLKVVLEPNEIDYFLLHGEVVGCQKEIVDWFARSHRLEVEYFVTPSLKQQLEWVAQGTMDMLCTNLTVVPWRKAFGLYSIPLISTPIVFVQRTKSSLEDTSRYVPHLDSLKNTRIHVLSHSIYGDLARPLKSSENRVKISELDHLKEQDLIKQVAEGTLDYTIASENMVRFYEPVYKNLDYHIVLEETSRQAWFLPTSADSLKNLVNQWLSRKEVRDTIRYIYYKYYNLPRDSKTFLAHFKKHHISFQTDEISPYDSLIRKYAVEIGWDWRLLASMIYEESRFRMNAQSGKGAIGLMQFIPSTAMRYGIDSSSSAEEQIAAGVKYLQTISRSLPSSIDSTERFRFVLASYNIGAGHIYDAIRLTEKYGDDPNRWYGHVEKYLVLKSRPEYYRDSCVFHGMTKGGKKVRAYVKNIEKRYKDYLNLTD